MASDFAFCAFTHSSALAPRTSSSHRYGSAAPRGPCGSLSPVAPASTTPPVRAARAVTTSLARLLMAPPSVLGVRRRTARVDTEATDHRIADRRHAERRLPAGA